MIPVRTGNPNADMAAVMARVRKMSDSQLADILAGKDVSVPQFAAMTEAMGRKQLRQAVDGQQAIQQAQQPSVKDQLLAEQSGLAALPAPNMQSIDMASGGIVAFADTGVVGPSKVKDEWESLKDYDPGAMTKGEGLGSDISNFFARTFDSGRKIDPETGKPISFGEFLSKQERRNVSAAAPSKAETSAFTDTTGVNPPAAPVAPTAAAPAAPTAPATDVNGRAKFERRANPFENMKAEAVDYEKLKSQGLGEGLMKMGAGLLSAPGSKGFAAGIQALAESGAVSRKEIAGLKKDARDYEFNIAKAREAADQGNDELALKYQQAADLNKYHMGMLNKPGEGLQLLNALKDPKLMALYQEMNAAKKPTDVVSRKDALKEFNDDPRLKRQFGDFETYYQTINNRLISGTLPSGAPVLGKV